MLIKYYISRYAVFTSLWIVNFPSVLSLWITNKNTPFIYEIKFIDSLWVIFLVAQPDSDTILEIKLFGALLKSNSYGVIPWFSTAWVILIRYADVNTKSPQKWSGIFAWKCKARAMFKICICLRFTHPFCWGVGTQEVSCMIPSFLVKHLKLELVNFVPLSLIILLICILNFILIRFLKLIKYCKVYVLCLIKYAHVPQV